MSAAPYLLDTNVILRFILVDNAVFLKKAEGYLFTDRQCVLSDLVFLEAIQVLERTYGHSRRQIKEELQVLLAIETIQAERRRLLLALDWYGRTNLDFVDCCLLANKQLFGFPIATFDKKLARSAKSL